VSILHHSVIIASQVLVEILVYSLNTIHRRNLKYLMPNKRKVYATVLSYFIVGLGAEVIYVCVYV